jgi:hypothetical protein
VTPPKLIKIYPEKRCHPCASISIAAATEQVKYLFTDNGLPPDVVKRFEQKGITVVLE